MKFNDEIKVKGIFSVKAYKADGTIEEYTDKNLIMDTARVNMAALIGAYTPGMPINKFVIGNKGHVGRNILDYKKVGANAEFIPSRTMLFSEDPAYNNENGEDNFAFSISFDVSGNNISETDANALGKIEGTTATQVCSVKRTIADRTCTFEITIPDVAGNKLGENEVVAYTEAALYAGTNIFSMKTFPARVKENTVKFVITWSIIF